MPRAKSTSRPPETAEQSGTQLRRPHPALSQEHSLELQTWSPQPLGARLQSQRARSFVGRESELSVIQGYLRDPSCSLVFITGQVGVGKTALLRQLEMGWRGDGHALVSIDAEGLFGRGIRNPTELLRVLRDGSMASSGALPSPRRVLLVDGIEKLRPSEISAFLEFLSALPDEIFVVAASRIEVPTELSLDPAWSSLVRRVKLEPLPEAACHVLLGVLAVPEGARASITAIAGGFPLALIAAAEALSRSANQGGSFDMVALTETQHTLIRRLCDEPVSTEQRFVLEVLSIARVTTAELIDQLSPHFGPTGSRDAYEDLARSSFVDSTPQGLIPHALMRAALRAHFRRERPHRYRALLQAIRECHVAAFEVSPTPVSEYLAIAFLDRETPAVPEWAALSASAPARQLRRAGLPEHDPIIDLILEKEGPDSAHLVRQHLRNEQDRFDVTAPASAPLGLVAHSLYLDAETAAWRLHDGDPANRVVCRALSQKPLERDEAIFVFRWWMDREVYQAPSLETLPIIALQTQQVLASKQVGRSYCVFRDPKEWEASWNNARVSWHRIGSFHLDKREHHVVEFDFRRRSVREVLLNPWENGERKWRFWRLVNEKQGEQESREMPQLDELRVVVKNRVAKLSHALRLTPREAEILEQLCFGESLEGIARALSIRPRTVKFHQENLLRKTGVTSRAELFRKLL